MNETPQDSKKTSRFVGQGGGVYLDTETERFYHRPQINGKRTYRLLDVRTLTEARVLKGKLDSDQTKHAAGLCADPYADTTFATVGALIESYRAKNYPDKQHKPRAGAALKKEEWNCNFLMGFFKDRRADQIKKGDCVAYFEHRSPKIRKGHTGGRTIDMELGTLTNVLAWAVETNKLEKNPLAEGRAKFWDRKNMRHCRDCMPVNAEELHALARALFEDRRSESLGWQLLLEAMTGCRTREILRLRWDAKQIKVDSWGQPVGEPGFIQGGFLHLHRAKGGVNPKAQIHPDLQDTLDAMRQWRISRGYGNSPWFIPSNVDPQKVVAKCSLTHSLMRLAPKIAGEGQARTSHGLRAYYVTARRSQRIPDAQIAAEIGDKTGAAIIASTYGGLPEIFQSKDAKPLGWAAQEPAWAALDLPQNLLEVAVG